MAKDETLISNDQRAFARTEGLYQAAKRTAEGYHNAGNRVKAIRSFAFLPLLADWRIAAELSEECFHMLRKRAEDLMSKQR